ASTSSTSRIRSAPDSCCSTTRPTMPIARGSRRGTCPSGGIARDSLRRTAPIHDLLSLALERLDPLADAVTRSHREPSDVEEIGELAIREPDEQVGEETPARFADERVVERAGERLPEVGDAPRRVAPDRRLGPRVEVDAARAVAVEAAGVPEGHAEIVDHHERPRASSRIA